MFLALFSSWPKMVTTKKKRHAKRSIGIWNVTIKVQMYLLTYLLYYLLSYCFCKKYRLSCLNEFWISYCQTSNCFTVVDTLLKFGWYDLKENCKQDFFWLTTSCKEAYTGSSQPCTMEPLANIVNGTKLFWIFWLKVSS